MNTDAAVELLSFGLAILFLGFAISQIVDSIGEIIIERMERKRMALLKKKAVF